MAVKRNPQMRKGKEGPVQPGVQLRIKHLVLEGRSKRDADQIARAVKGELTRLLAEGGLPKSWKSGKHIPVIKAGEISAHTDAPYDTQGGQIARAVYGNSGKWEEIYKANSDKMKDENDLKAGQVIVIPKP